ncbi:MAG: hypothetical protein DWH86_03265 [Planctomycetota bacterium]|nr:MAG: hypothetical protein DWH86_03265 [Planctomycetota bacterium]
MSLNGDAFGSLAALFTTGSGGEGQSARTTDGPTLGAITTVLVGNLPVMAGLWTTQFADAVARIGGPTALVRFERDDVTIELLRADGRQVPPAGPAAVSRWLPRAASTVRRWLICVPADTSPADVLAVGKEILLMTGADEAAVTGAYLRLKYLADEGINSGTPIERVGLVVVGATPEQAAHAAARLGDAARSFLGVDVETVACLPRIERVESSARATYPAEECPPIAQFTRELEAARASASHRFDSDNSAPPLTMTTEPAAVEPKFPSMSQPFASRSEPVSHGDSAMETIHAPQAGSHAHSAHSAHSAHTTHPAPTRSSPAFAALPTADLPLKLVPLLRGLRPLGISCPMAPDVELALDDERRMHIVGRTDQLARIRTVRTWATMHRELLGMAFAELKDGFEVRERVLLGDAREAISLHGTGVLLDVLVIAETPTGRVQVVVPLNDPMTCG